MSQNNKTGATRTEVSRSPITLDKMYAAQYQKEGTVTAQIRQIVDTKSFYPSKQVSTNLQANIFGLEEFGFKEEMYPSTETRVAWIPVPTGLTEEQIKTKLDMATKAGACIYKVLSNHPILDDNQKYAIANSVGEITNDSVANSQVVRYPDTHEKAGQIIKDGQEKVQYRRTFFWNTPMEDSDARTSDPADYYVSSEIAAELQGASVMEGQTL